MSSAPTDPPALRRIWIRTGQKKQPFSGDGIITASSLPIKLRRYTRTCRRCRRMDGSESETWTEPTTVGTEIVVINFGLAKEESLYREKEYVPMLNQCLDNIGVPRSVQPSVVGEIFGLVDQATTVPMVLVDVLIRDVTELWVGDDDAAIADHEWSVLNRAIRESMAGDVYRAKLIPATKPSIQSLEKVRRCQVEAVVKETPNCVVCMDSLLDEQAEEEARRNNKRKRHDEEEEVTTRGAKKLIKLSKSSVEFFQKMVTVTRLPCLHHFHTDCIVPWLEINHTCPVCRNAISTQLENLN